LQRCSGLLSRKVRVFTQLLKQREERQKVSSKRKEVTVVIER